MRLPARATVSDHAKVLNTSPDDYKRIESIRQLGDLTIPDYFQIPGGKLQRAKTAPRCTFDESKERMKQPPTPPPQACLALGNLAFDGEISLGATRVSTEPWGLLLDGVRSYRKVELHGLPVWLQVPAWTATVEAPPAVGQIASLILDEGRPTLLFALWTSAGLSAFAGPFAAGRIPPSGTPPSQPEDEAVLEQLEDHLLRRQMLSVEQQLTHLTQAFPFHPRVWFARGVAAQLQQNHRLSRDAFHQAMLLGHPDALTAEWLMAGLLAKPFRMRHQKAFELLDRGAWPQAVSEFQAIAKDEPLHGNATLAYLLRRGGDPVQGVEACKASLARDPLQADVYSHLWSFLTTLGMDHEARIVAQTRLLQFPQDVAACHDGLDSSLLLEDLPSASHFLWGALCNSQNFNTALKSLFKYYEALRDWATLRHHFEAILPFLRAPTPETLVLYGEVLTELGDFVAAHPVLERAVGATPESPDGVLAYARSLARAGEETQAAKFLMTVLGDRHRIDGIEDRLLLIALLSEILSRTGRPREALQLWPALAEFTPELLAKVGPRPFVEFGYCLLQAGEPKALRWIEHLVSSQFPEMHIVKEFRTIVHANAASDG